MSIPDQIEDIARNFEHRHHYDNPLQSAWRYLAKEHLGKSEREIDEGWQVITEHYPTIKTIYFTQSFPIKHCQSDTNIVLRNIMSVSHYDTKRRRDKIQSSLSLTKTKEHEPRYWDTTDNTKKTPTLSELDITEMLMNLISGILLFGAGAAVGYFIAGYKNEHKNQQAPNDEFPLTHTTRQQPASQSPAVDDKNYFIFTLRADEDLSLIDALKRDENSGGILSEATAEFFDKFAQMMIWFGAKSQFSAHKLYEFAQTIPDIQTTSSTDVVFVVLETSDNYPDLAREASPFNRPPAIKKILNSRPSIISISERHPKESVREPLFRPV